MNDNIFINKINDFLVKELYQNMNDIAIFQLEDGSYELFNKYQILQNKLGFKIIPKYNSTERQFFSLKHAVTWCIFQNMNKFYQSTRIEFLDNLLAATDTSIEIHKHLISSTKDPDNRSIFLAKLIEEQNKKKLMKKELERFIFESKFWQTRKFRKNDK